MAFPLAPAELAHAGLHAHGFIRVDLAPAELAHDGLAPAELASDLLAPDELAPAGLAPAEQWHVAEDCSQYCQFLHVSRFNICNVTVILFFI